MDADDGVCAYSLADPVDALTVAWRDDDMVSNDPNTKCTGHCNFGVSLITDYLDEDGGKIKQKKIRAHRGIMLLSLVERHDPQMEWDASHPDIAAKSGRTVIYEWGITPVDIVGTIEESNLCLTDGQGSPVSRPSSAIQAATSTPRASSSILSRSTPSRPPRTRLR
jgi:hypothetical protein